MFPNPIRLDSDPFGLIVTLGNATIQSIRCVSAFGGTRFTFPNLLWFDLSLYDLNFPFTQSLRPSNTNFCKLLETNSLGIIGGLCITNKFPIHPLIYTYLFSLDYLSFSSWLLINPVCFSHSMKISAWQICRNMIKSSRRICYMINAQLHRLNKPITLRSLLSFERMRTGKGSSLSVTRHYVVFLQS